MTPIENIDYMISILNALKTGKQVQFIQTYGSIWLDFPDNVVPDFSAFIYRIKPTMQKYRLGLFRETDQTSYVLAFNTDESAHLAENNRYFVGWMADWVEYEAY